LLFFNLFNFFQLASPNVTIFTNAVGLTNFEKLRFLNAIESLYECKNKLTHHPIQLIIVGWPILLEN
jgi:hypothetical protein